LWKTFHAYTEAESRKLAVGEDCWRGMHASYINIFVPRVDSGKYTCSEKLAHSRHAGKDIIHNDFISSLRQTQCCRYLYLSLYNVFTYNMGTENLKKS